MSTDVRRILVEGAQQPADGLVYVPGGWVQRRATVPTDGGVQGLVHFAEKCWQSNIKLQRQLMELRYPQKGSADAQE